MDFDIIPASLDRIETADRTFQITTRRDIAELVLSIGAVGLLHPPLLIEKGRAYTVVCGFRRIAACKALKMESIPARILRPIPSWMDCARIAISDNAFQRQLNIVEQARAFALIHKYAENSASWLTLAESTGLPGSQTAMDRIMPVAGMSSALQDAILDGSVALPIAMQIDRLNKNDARALGGFLHKITTGLNIQREMLALITDISIRDGISIAELIEQDDIAAIMANQRSPAPQKVQALRLILKAKRYPELSKAEAAYNRVLKTLKLDPRIQFQPPRFFEGNAYRLSMTIGSLRELKELTSELEKLAQHPNLLPE